MTLERRIQILNKTIKTMQSQINFMVNYINSQSIKKEYIYREIYISGQAGVATQTLRDEINEGWECIGIVKSSEGRITIYLKRDKTLPFKEKTLDEFVKDLQRPKDDFTDISIDIEK